MTTFASRTSSGGSIADGRHIFIYLLVFFFDRLGINFDELQAKISRWCDGQNRGLYQLLSRDLKRSSCINSVFEKVSVLYAKKKDEI